MRALLLLASIAAAAIVLGSPAGAQTLYWIDTNYATPAIHRANADGVALGTLALAAGSLPEGLALDATGRVYFGEAAWTNAAIRRVTPALAGLTPIVTGGSVIRGVAVSGAFLYWTTSNLASGGRIHRSALDGTGVVTLVTLAPGQNPRGIAVDPVGARIYWTDFETHAIWRANLDGTAAAQWLATGPSTGPYGIVVDGPGQRIYWTEYISGWLRSVSTSGASPATLVTGLVNPTYVTFDPVNARLYFSEGGVGNHRIRRIRTNATELTTLPCPLTTYGGLAFQTNGAVSSDTPPPTELAFDGAWPNPGNGPFRMAFALPGDTRLRLSVFDLQGREVAVLDDGVVPAGRHERTWDARSSAGAMPAGIYFARLVAADRTWVRRLVLIP